MVCRHSAGDPDCGSSPAGQRRIAAERDRDEARREAASAAELRKQLQDLTPDSSNYTIEEIERVGSHLVVRVRYPSCRKCEYEGNKVMVFLNVGEMQAVRWKRIDPHFRPPAKAGGGMEAPSPSARFPATKDGWADALSYARGKQ